MINTFFILRTDFLFFVVSIVSIMFFVVFFVLLFSSPVVDVRILVPQSGREHHDLKILLSFLLSIFWIRSI